MSSPYVGDRPFSFDDADSFAGRAAETNEIVNSWRAVRLTVLHGPAGIGKTSLLKAGVVPRLKVIHRAEPLLYLADDEPPLELLRRVEEAEARHPVLLAFDGGCPTAELVTPLARRPDVHLLVLTRSHRLTECEALATALGATVHGFELGPLMRFGTAQDALTHPLRNLDYNLADIADAMLDALSGDRPTVSPYLLQIASARLWELLNEDESAATAFDVHAAIADHTALVMNSLTSEHGLHYCDIASWLRRDFLIPGGGIRPVPTLDRPPNLDEKVVRSVEDKHLIRTIMINGVSHWELIDPAFEHALRRSGGTAPDTVAPDPVERLEDARRLRAEDNLEGAKNNLDTVLRYAPPDSDASAEASFGLGEIHASQGRVEAADFHFKEATYKFTVLGENTRVAHALAERGRLYLLAQNDPNAAEQALQLFKDAMRRAQHVPEIRLDLARAYLAKGQAHAAEAVLEEAMTRSDTGREIGVLLGGLQADLGDPEEALRTLNRSLSPNEPGVRVAIALARLRLPDPDEEEARTQLDPDPPPDDGPTMSRAARAWRLLRDDDRADALELLSRDARIPVHPHQRDLRD